MKKSEAIKEIMQMVNYHDGGNMEAYVANNLVHFLVEKLGMLPPAEHLNPEKQAGRSLPFYSNEWEPEDEEK